MGHDLTRSAGQSLATSSAAMMHLGTIQPLGLSENGPLAKALNALAARSRQYAGPEPQAREQHEIWLRRMPMSYRDYVSLVSKLDIGGRVQREISRNGFVEGFPLEWDFFAAKIFNRDLHAPDVVGYGNYLAALHPIFAGELQKVESENLTLQLPEAAREMHSLIIGRSGAGKSELLKLIIHHYVKHPELGAVVVLDPQGKLASEVARWREFAGSSRLVYLDALLGGDEVVPALNPIVKRQDATENELASNAKQVADALAYLAGEGEGLSNYMQRLATYCVRVLLTEGGTLLDLRRALISKDGGWLVAAGKKHHDPIVREHFEHEFFAENWKTAKAGLAGRLGGALFVPVFRHMMTASSEIDLEPLLEARKVVVVNCGAAHEANVALGRLMMAQLAAIGQRRIYRTEKNPTPVHVVVDEATMLMAPPVFTILDQLRKAGIHLTMAQQRLGDGLGPNERKALATAPEVKMIGRCDALGSVLKNLGWDDLAEPPSLKRGQFLTRWGNDGDGLLVDTTTASHLADDKNAMGEQEWQALKAKQLEAFYRRPAGNVAGARPGSAEIPKGSPGPGFVDRWRDE